MRGERLDAIRPCLRRLVAPRPPQRERGGGEGHDSGGSRRMNPATAFRRPLLPSSLLPPDASARPPFGVLQTGTYNEMGVSLQIPVSLICVLPWTATRVARHRLRFRLRRSKPRLPVQLFGGLVDGSTESSAWPDVAESVGGAADEGILFCWDWRGREQSRPPKCQACAQCSRRCRDGSRGKGPLLEPSFRQPVTGRYWRPGSRPPLIPARKRTFTTLFTLISGTGRLQGRA